MNLGLHINDFAWPVAPERRGPTLAEIARAGEAAGFATIAVMGREIISAVADL